MEDAIRKDPVLMLPRELSRHIFSFLPVKCLFRCMPVSKQWHAFLNEIRNSHNGKLQLLVISSRRDYYGKKKYRVRSINPDLSLQWVSSSLFTINGQDLRFFEVEFPPRIMDSCKELVLVSTGTKIVVWNPLTKWFRIVFDPYNNEVCSAQDCVEVVGSICYDVSIKDYKIVLVLRRFANHRHFVFTTRCVSFACFKSNTWKNLAFPSGVHSSRSSVNFRNTFHWSLCHDVHIRSSPFRNIPIGRNNKIAYFDPVNDVFKILPSPEPCHREEDDWIVGMGIVNDCLCLARLDSETRTVQILAMKEYGNGESWFRAFDISLSKFGCDAEDLYTFNFFSLEKNGKVFMKYGHKRRTLVYDPVKEDVFTVESLLPDSETNLSMCFYAQSCASHMTN
ncbi:unnamed protein product [Cuscuta epithymum]|uniref:F-box domain-containing protein n=1 Tax=Cuscuta epithymum TaxID=186058 RepID=A0AAV0DC06_9ASTE|nr:unnamed protein product [Cuscuta epithymum]